MDRRPTVVISVGASVDGRVALSREQVLLQEPSGCIWTSLSPAGAARLDQAREAEVERIHGPTAVLEGSGTFLADAESPAELPPVSGSSGDLYADFLPTRIAGRPSPPHKWFTVVDSRGRVRWDHQDDGDWSVLVLVARATPAPYLAYLRDLGICYLLVGDERVDLPAALVRMRDRLNVRCVVSKAGGGLNGALVRAGLVDEVQVVLAPALVGGLGTPSIVDGPPLGVGEQPTRLRLLSVRAETDGAVWLRYEVRPENSGDGCPAAPTESAP